jgi:oligoendopeptidase F
MGDHSVDKEKDEALAMRDAFRSDPGNLKQVEELIQKADAKTKKSLRVWRSFFEIYQTPAQAISLKKKIDSLESDILKKRAEITESYIDPYTNKFVEASALKISTMINTHEDQKIRQACFLAQEKLALDHITEYLELVKLRNQYAKTLGYTDFYDFKVQREDGMTKTELFSIFEAVYEKTKYAKGNIKKLEKKMPGLRKPWNFSYLMTGNFTKEEDPYFQFDEALLRWGKSFSALGVNFEGGVLQLDLLDRKGKWNNGFCHAPNIVRFENGARKFGSTNFTCNVVYGQVGSANRGYATLFHEGGHAAHFTNMEQKEICLNTEYAPMSASWSESHSMFFDTIFDSIEWRTRYAINKEGQSYPFELFERKVHKLSPIRPLGLNGIIFVCNFEREIYEAKDLDQQKIKEIAKKNYRKYYERSEDSLFALNVPHIYSWESAASYHGYGLAQLSLSQWREYFYKKYGYIVDNPKIGKEMAKVWKMGSSKTFREFVVLATGNKLSSKAYLKEATLTVGGILKRAKSRIKRLEKVSLYNKPINLNATVRMFNGKTEIANSKVSFEEMAGNYKRWLNSERA